MKYTVEQLEKMSDFEINKALAERLYKDAVVTRAVESFNAVTIKDADDTLGCVAYCSSWADIMPLAIEYDVTYVKDAEAAIQELANVFDLGGSNYGVSYFHKSPQRAIACCILMMEID